jgi:hypothetical protein
VQPAVQREPQGANLVLVLPRGDIIQRALLRERERPTQSEGCVQASANHSDGHFSPFPGNTYPITCSVLLISALRFSVQSQWVQSKVSFMGLSPLLSESVAVHDIHYD